MDRCFDSGGREAWLGLRTRVAADFAGFVCRYCFACSGMAVSELKRRREWICASLCNAAVQVVPVDYVTVREVLWILVSHEALLRPKV